MIILSKISEDQKKKILIILSTCAILKYFTHKREQDGGDWILEVATEEMMGRGRKLHLIGGAHSGRAGGGSERYTVELATIKSRSSMLMLHKPQYVR